MMLTTLLLSLASAAQPAAAPSGLEGLEVQWSAPSSYIAGSTYPVEITIAAPAGGGVVAGWMLTPGAFTIDGQPVAAREAGEPMALPSGFTITGSVDLAPFISQSGQFKLAYAGELLGDDPFVVSVLEPAPEGLDFMTMPVEQLTDYNVVLETNRGTIVAEFWPEVAPNHVRNYLDLAYTGFYDGIIFHRVIPGFMIQGGDPTGTGTGSGPLQRRPAVRARAGRAVDGALAGPELGLLPVLRHARQVAPPRQPVQRLRQAGQRARGRRRDRQHPARSGRSPQLPPDDREGLRRHGLRQLSPNTHQRIHD